MQVPPQKYYLFPVKMLYYGVVKFFVSKFEGCFNGFTWRASAHCQVIIDQEHGFSFNKNTIVTSRLFQHFYFFLINDPQSHFTSEKELTNNFSLPFFEQLWHMKYFVGSVSSTFTFSLWQDLSNGLRGECNIFLQTVFQKTSESKWLTLWYSLLMEPSCTCCSNVFPSRIIVPNGRVRKLKRISTKSPLASATITRLFFSSTQYLKGILTSSLEAITET